MSEDESPTGGQQPSTDYDPNSSIIGKVRSRVSSILPQTLTNWFSPTANDSSQNGSIRRRRGRDENLDRDGEDSQNTEDSDIGEEDEEENAAPPHKRVRLNPEEHEITETYHGNNQSINRHFLSSTPTTESRRRPLDISRNQREISCNFDSATTSTLTSSRLAETRGICISDETDNTIVTHKSQHHRELEWNDSKKISSRRSLNIPSSTSVTRRLPDLRRQSLKKMRTGLDSSRSSYSFQDQDLEEVQEQDESDTEGKAANIGMASKAGERENSILTNGVGASTNIVVQVDDASESGDSQCSSLQRPKHPGMLSTAPRTLRTPMGNGLNFYTHLEGKKSLFSDKNMSNILNNSTTSLTSLNRRQSFNASLYGSTSALSDSRILNTTSPFYKGRTTYGGASAYSKYSLQTQRALRTPTLIRPTSSLSTLSSSNNSLAQSSDTSSAISNTAKRILELMNQFTSPLIDAKKMANNIKVPALIAHKKRFGESELQASRAIRLSTPKTPYSRPLSLKTGESKELRPPINELQVPSMSQLLQMKKLQNNTERVREIANSSKSILNRQEEYKLPAEIQNTDSGSNKHVSKIKNKVTSTRLSKKAVVDEQEHFPSVNLPDIPLPFMKSVPKIDIPISSSSTTTISSASSSKKLATSKSSLSSLESSKSNNTKKSCTTLSGNAANLQKAPNSSIQVPSLARNNSDIVNTKPNYDVEFKFSAPIPVEITLKSNIEPINNFKFSAPVPISNSSKVENFKYLPNPKPSIKDEHKAIESNVSVSKAATPQLKTGSVLDALKRPVSVEKSDSKPLPSLSEQFKTSNTWECSVCMIRNDNSRDKCEACETPRKKTDQPAVSESKCNPKPLSTQTFGDAFKPKSDTWECQICMVRNKNDDVKCIACSASKPGTTTSVPQSSLSSTVPKTMDTGFKNIVAQQASKWECSVCMSRNEPNRTKCICCEQAKPGSGSDNAPKFSFGASGSKFTFGFSGQKEEELKKSEESKEKTVTSASLTDVKKAPEAKPADTGFTFGNTSGPPAATASTSNVTFGFKPVTSQLTAEPGKDVTDKSSGGIKFATSVQNKTKGEEKTTKNVMFGSTAKNAATENKTENKDAQPATGFKFGNPVAPTTPVQQSTAINNQKDTIQASAFKPVGGFTFGSTSSKTEITKASTESPIKPAFSFGASTSSASETNKLSTTATESSTVQKPDSTAEVKTSFKFGATAEIKSADEKKPNFSFGAATSTSAIPVFGSQTQKSAIPNTGLFAPAQMTSSAPNTSTTSTFVFGKPSALSTSATPLFGAVSSSTSTASNSTAVSSTPSFGSVARGAATTTSPLFPCVTSPLVTSKPAFSSSPQQSNTFGNSFSASVNTTQQNNNSSGNLFAFGASSKTEPTKAVFGSVSSTSKPFPLGSGNGGTNSSTSFVFGGSAQKPAESTPVFGSVSSNTSNAASGSLPGFGSFSSPTTSSQQPQAASAFGLPAPNATPFGSSNPTVFGSPITAAASAGSIFGSSAPSFGNNSAPGFGSSNSTFGSSTPAASTFGSTFSSDGPAAKKPEPAFNFGGSTQNSTGGFQFGANNNNNNNNNKPAFNFSAPTPSFNFSGSQEATNSSQPFQFGTAPIAPAVFNFSGVETAPNAPFQFSAAPAANNLFAPTPTQGTPSSLAARRKMRAQTRRPQPRQANS